MKFALVATSAILCFFSSQAIAGAWDIGPFDNDDALDWVWELSESNDLSVVRGALQEANSNSAYLEAPSASIAHAAAEVVAALRGNPRAQLPAEVSEWVENQDTELDENLVVAARKAVVRIQDPDTSELAQLWADSDKLLQQWHKELANLALRLK